MATKDEARREVEVPEVLRRAISRDVDARAAWESFPYSHRKRYVDWILEAKREETRQRRTKKAVEMIASKRPPR